MEIIQCPLFSNISQEECQRILLCFGANRCHFLPGELLSFQKYQQGKIGLLLSGRADVVRLDYDGSRTLMEPLEEGCVFGEALAFSGGSCEQLYLECHTRCEILFFDYDHFTKRCSNACAHHNQLLQNLFSLLSKKVLIMSSRVEVLSHRSIRAKLLCYFRITAAAAQNTSFELPFSITALSEYICADRSAMMRELKSLKEEGYLTMAKRHVTLLPPATTLP